MGSSCLVVLKFNWSTHVISSYWDLCVAGLAQLGFVVELLWAWLSL